jgi:hypothetical protein
VLWSVAGSVVGVSTTITTAVGTSIAVVAAGILFSVGVVVRIASTTARAKLPLLAF